MIGARDWIDHARILISKPQGIAAFGLHADFIAPSQIEMRRAISAAYYGLFHLLTTEATRAFAAGGERLRFQAARAFSHAVMRKVCDAYVRSPLSPFPSSLEHLNRRPPSPQLIEVARAFGLLQEGRYTADYDLRAVIEIEGTAQLVRIAEAAHADFEAVRTLPETTVFLTALLLNDRWTRRG